MPTFPALSSARFTSFDLQLGSTTGFLLTHERLLTQLNLANEAFQNHQLDQAQLICDEILASDSDEPKTLHLLGCIHKEKGDFKSAISCIHKSIQCDNSDPYPFLSLGKIYILIGDYKQAGYLFQESLKLNQYIPDAWYWFGNSLRYINKGNDAIRAYQTSLKLKCDHADSAANLGALLLDEGEAQRSIVILERAIQLNPENNNCYFNLAAALKKVGDIKSAISTYRQLISIDNNNPIAHFNLGLSLREIGDEDQAVSCFRTAIKLDPKYVSAYYELAKALSTIGRFIDSVNISKQALEVEPDNPLIAGSLGLNFFRAGLIDNAISFYSSRLSRGFCPVSAYYLFRALDMDIPTKINSDFHIASSFCSSAMSYMCVDSIVAFGDSHVRVFDGIDKITTCYVGASTAFNLIRSDSSSGGAKKIWSYLRNIKSCESSTAILLSFGEIDCRNHIIMQCYKQAISISQSTQNVVDNYISFIKEILRKGFKVIVYGCYGSGSHFNSVGSEVERNLASAEFNRIMRIQCDNLLIPFFSLIHYFVDDNGYTRSSLMQDDAHLPESGIAGQEIRALLMSSLLSSCKRLYSDSAKSSFDNPMQWNNVYCNLGVANLGESSQSSLYWSPSGKLEYKTRKNDVINSIFLDLGACVLIKSIKFVFSGADLASFSSKFPFAIFFDGVEVLPINTCCYSSDFVLCFDKYFVRYIRLSSTPTSQASIRDLVQLIPDIVLAQP